MTTDLERAQSRLALYYAAEAAILSGAQEYTIEGRRVRKADLPTIQEAIRELKSEVADLQGAASGTSRLITVVPQ